MFYRPGEEEFEADLDENEVGESQNRPKKEKDKPKKHKIITRKNIKNFTKQQIKDTIVAGGFTLLMASMYAGLDMGGVLIYSASAFVAKKVFNAAHRKIFGKKHMIRERISVAKFSDYVKMTISAGGMILPLLIGTSPIALAVAAGGAVSLSTKLVKLLIKDKKVNEQIDKENKLAVKEARIKAKIEREQKRQARQQNRPTEEEQNEDENVDENEDENQYQNGRTR